MAVEVRIPTILRKHTGGEKAVTADGDTVRDLLGETSTGATRGSPAPAHRGRLPAPLRQRLCQRRGRPLPGALDAKLADGDVVAILPAVAGG